MRDAIFGISFASSAGSTASAPTQARVIVTGQMCPFSTCVAM